MPCYDSRNDPAEIMKESKQRLDLATRVACEMSKIIKEAGLGNKLSSEAYDWTVEHEKMDAERVRYEQNFY